MEKQNQINEIMSSAIEKIKELADANTVVGVPFETKDGTLIIPITRVSVGFVAGGGEYGTNPKNFKSAEQFPFTGGSGAGLSINPIGLLMVNSGDVKLIHINEKSPYEKLMDTIPAIVSDVTSLFKKGDE